MVLRSKQKWAKNINIPETTDEIKYNVRDTIKKVLGMEIKDIDLFFKQIKAKG